MTLSVLPEAEQEFLDSVLYYERQEQAVGQSFRNEVARGVEWIQLNFDVPPLRPKGYRRVNLKVFPHYIAYIIRDETIWVVAIAHVSRRTEHWIERI